VPQCIRIVLIEMHTNKSETYTYIPLMYFYNKLMIDEHGFFLFCVKMKLHSKYCILSFLSLKTLGYGSFYIC